MAAVAGPLAALHSGLCGVELVSFYLLDLRVSGPAIFRDFEIESDFLSKFDFGISIAASTRELDFLFPARPSCSRIAASSLTVVSSCSPLFGIGR